MDPKLIQELGQLLTKINNLLNSQEALFIKPCVSPLIKLLTINFASTLFSATLKILPIIIQIYPDVYKKGAEMGLNNDFKQFIKFLIDEKHLDDKGLFTVEALIEAFPFINELTTELKSGKPLQEIMSKLETFLTNLEKKLITNDSSLKVQFRKIDPNGDKSGSKRKRTDDDDDSSEDNNNPLKKLFRERDR